MNRSYPRILFKNNRGFCPLVVDASRQAIRPQAGAAPNSEVQWGQRLALRGISGQAEGHSRVVGSAGGASCFPFHAVDALDHQEYGKGDDE